MQWWCMSSAAGGWLKKCFAHTAAYSISILKTAQAQNPNVECQMLILSLFLLFCLMGGSGANIKGMLNVRPPVAVTTGGPERAPQGA